VVGELHRVDRPALRCGTQRSGVTEHLRQRHDGVDDLCAATLLHATDLPATGRQVAHHVTHVISRGDDLHIHHRLEQNRIGPTSPLLERHGTGDLEGHLGRVDVVIRTEDQLHLDVDHRVPGEHAVVHRLTHPLGCTLDVLTGDHATADLVLEDEARARLTRFDVDDHVSVLTTATALPDELALDALDCLADRLPVGHLRPAHVRVDLELTQQPV